ncbi:MAG: hypothetical protein GH151_01040 [Bacteroidetes bacterium]|nr:hypothetical protein [Bacteroidota bacterium]
MSNSFNISDAPDIAANLVQILSNASALATIQITDLPGIADEINENQVFIEAIIDTHLPGVITEIDENETKIDTIGGNVDSILALKRFSDYTPHIAHIDASGTLLNIASGKGFLTGIICVPLESAAGSVEVVVTIDGVALTTYYGAWALAEEMNAAGLPFLHYFDTSINIEITLAAISARTTVSYVLL